MGKQEVRRRHVTQIFNLRFRRFVTGGVCVVGWDVRVGAVEGSADCKSVIRQVANLRYGGWNERSMDAEGNIGSMQIWY